jgi:hypothetical protein
MAGKVQYRTFDVMTEQGFVASERLLARGWTISRSGMFTVQMTNLSLCKAAR